MGLKGKASTLLITLKALDSILQVVEALNNNIKELYLANNKLSNKITKFKIKNKTLAIEKNKRR
jgi:hypothetical protein